MSNASSRGSRHNRKPAEQSGKGGVEHGEDTYRAILDSAPDGFIVVDRTGKITLINPEVERLFGYERAEVIGQSIEMLLPERFRGSHVHHRDRYADTPYKRLMGSGTELTARRKDGTEFPVDVSLSPVTIEGKPYYSAAVRNISDQRQAERERARLAAFPERNPFPVLECDRKGRITYTNPAAEQLLAPPVPGVSRRDLDQQLFPGFVDSVRRCLAERIPIRGKETQHGLRTYLWSLHPVSDVGRVHVYAMDITVRKQAEEALRNQSLLDDLTGLYNRRGFTTLAEQQLKLAHRQKRPLAMVFIDLDNLKWINDSFGHLEGDRAIQRTAEILQQTFRESDVLGRVGGDEFAILPVLASDQILRDLESRLLAHCRESNSQGNHPYELTYSIGIAFHDAGKECSLEELMARADASMYERKRAKKEPAAPTVNERT